MRCSMCGDLGWVLDIAGGQDINKLAEPLMLELLPCLLPDCAASGRRIEHLSVNTASFERAVTARGLVMALGR